MKSLYSLLVLFIVIPPLSSQDSENKISEFEKKWLSDSKKILDLVKSLREYKFDTSDSSLQKENKKELLAKGIINLNQKLHKKYLELEAIRVVDVNSEKTFLYKKYRDKKSKLIGSRLMKSSKWKKIIIKCKDSISFLINYKNCNSLLKEVESQLANCKRCRKKAIIYKIEYDIPVPYIGRVDENYGKVYKDDYISGINDGYNKEWNEFNLLKVKIFQLIESQKKALEYSKGDILRLKGKIKLIYYDGVNDEIKIDIY